MPGFNDALVCTHRVGRTGTKRWYEPCTIDKTMPDGERFRVSLIGGAKRYVHKSRVIRGKFLNTAAVGRSPDAPVVRKESDGENPVPSQGHNPPR